MLREPLSKTVTASQYACPIMGKVTIGMARCQDTCRQPRTNEEKCSAVQCASPFRLCRKCVVQNAANPNLSVDSATGLCKACAKPSPARLEAERVLSGIGQSTPAEGSVIPLHRNIHEIPARTSRALAFHPAHGDENLPIITAQTDPASEMGHSVFIPAELVDPLPDQPRLEFDEADEIALTTSIKENGQLIAGEVVPLNGRYQLTDGERRLRSCKRLGFPFKAVIADIRGYSEQKKRSILMNFNRKSHSPIETALAMRFLQSQIRQEAKNHGENVSENQVRIKISTMLGCSLGNVTNHLKILDDLDPRIIELLRPQKNGNRPLRLSVALELTPFHEQPDAQFSMAWEIMQKNMQLPAARLFIAHYARKMGVKKGRGLERKPANQREILETALLRFRHILTEVLERSEFELRQMFERAQESKFRELLDLARAERDQTAELVEVLEAVRDNISAIPVTEEEAASS